MSGSQRPQTTPEGKPAKRGRGEVARLLVAVALAVLITLFAVLNTKSVEVNWIFGKSEAPLIVVIVVSLVVGVVFTLLVMRRSKSRAAKSAKKS